MKKTKNLIKLFGSHAQNKTGTSSEDFINIHKILLYIPFAEALF